MSLMQTLAGWSEQLEATPLATAIAESSNLFPLLETAHVVGLGLLLGTITIVDLRLLDLASRSRPVRELVAETLPYTWIGFGIALITGALMFISRATTYFENTPFRVKMVLLALAGLNMLAFHFLTFRTVEHWGVSGPTPHSARWAGGSSIALWILIVFFGRWIAFTE